MIEHILKKIENSEIPNENEIVSLLKCTGADEKLLYKKADKIREIYTGNSVYLRGLIEFSNYCKKDCSYCGIRKSCREISRYRILPNEIFEIAKQINDYPCKTIVLQSGEDSWYTKSKIIEVLKKIKKEINIAITLSIGEWSEEDYIDFRNAGCDRFLLRFETSDRKVFESLHPGDDFEKRIECIKSLKKIGIQTGSGFLIGIPGESIDLIAKDIIFTTKLDLDMIGCGPFIPESLDEELFLKDKTIYLKTISILRLLNPKAHIPSTTSFSTLFENGAQILLKQGANVIMPNFTPCKFKQKYLLYPNKPNIKTDIKSIFKNTKSLISGLKRTIGSDFGHTFK